MNPYVGNTRPSNVRVCRFRHSRRALSIIQHKSSFVKGFFRFFTAFVVFDRGLSYLKSFLKKIDKMFIILYNIFVRYVKTDFLRRPYGRV